MALEKELWDKELQLKGPFSFRYDADNCIFKQKDDGRKSAGVYIWTIRSSVDKHYYIHYVGESPNIAGRQLDHLISMLGLFYGAWDIAKARQIELGMKWKPEDDEDAEQGKFGIIWEGLWRLRRQKSKKPISDVDILGEYKRLHKTVIANVENIDIFFANTKEFKKPEEPIGKEELKKNYLGYHWKRKHIEGSIADMLEAYPPEIRKNISALYPRDNATGVSARMDLTLRIYFPTDPKDVVIMGLNHDREKVKFEGRREFVEIMI